MKIGLFMMPIHNLNREMHLALEEDKEAILLADQLGFEEVWVGEHFSAITEPIPSPMMFMASLIPHLKNMTLTLLQ